ncbi:MAG: aspartate aminotransferase family protein [Candidatus Wallbacteria bacterium]|nr:aspartate aminotransferase family protein [Candidatus Wallbacteria bacterium]
MPFGDLSALEERLATRLFAAFVVEPIQCEAGVRIPSAGYLSSAQELCRRHGTLLVADEVQTGLGRTGRWFAHEAEGFVPDVLALAKSLGGGIAPVGATVTTAAIHRRAYGRLDRFDLHGSTFAGNAFGCVAGLETLAILADERLVENAEERGRQLLAALKRGLEGHPLVRDVRGRGLLAAIELGASWDAGGLLGPPVQVLGQWASLELLERGILCQPASQQWTVLRLEPPLTIGAAEIDRLAAAVCEVLADRQSLVKTMADVATRVSRQFVSGWKF